MRPGLTLTLTLTLTSCGGADGDARGDDTGAPPWCADAPVVTWDSFGQGFVTEHCQACHASETADRNGAPADVVFDTHAAVQGQAARMLARAGGPDPSMPPRGGVPDDDIEKLEIWLQCWGGE